MTKQRAMGCLGRWALAGLVAVVILCPAAFAPRALAGTNDPPTIKDQPQDDTAVAYSPGVKFSRSRASFHVGASGDNLQYQWFHNGNAIPPDTNASAATATLAIEQARVEDAGIYWADVWNNAGHALSQQAQLSVLGITNSPLSQIVLPGDLVLLQADAAGPGLRYQWKLNGQLIDDATNSTYTITNAQPVDGGSYSVVVFNDWGIVESEPATVQVTTPPLPFADDFAMRGLIIGVSGTGQGNNASATREDNEPKHARSHSTNSVWITWEAPANGIATFDTRGSAFDTVLAIYTGDTLSRLSRVARDEESGGFHTSRAVFRAKAGVQYQVAVDTYSKQAGGDIVLNWTLLADYPFPDVINVPDNLTVMPGQDLYICASIASSYEPTLQWFHDDHPLPNATNACLLLTNITQADVGRYALRFATFWIFLTEPIEVQINTEGSSASAYNKLEDAKRAPLVSVAPAGSLPAVSGYTGSQSFNSYPGKDPEEPNACGVVGGASYWFTYVPPESGTLSLNTDGSNFDTVLGLYRDDGRDLGYASLIPVACDNNSGANHRTSALTNQVVGHTMYFIMVDGINGAYGLIVLNYHLAPPPPVPVSLSILPTVATGQVQVKLVGKTNQLYILQVATNAGQYNWISVATNRTTNGIAFFTDRSPSSPVRFYRAREP